MHKGFDQDSDDDETSADDRDPDDAKDLDKDRDSNSDGEWDPNDRVDKPPAFLVRSEMAADGFHSVHADLFLKVLPQHLRADFRNSKISRVMDLSKTCGWLKILCLRKCYTVLDVVVIAAPQ